MATGNEEFNMLVYVELDVMRYTSLHNHHLQHNYMYPRLPCKVVVLPIVLFSVCINENVLPGSKDIGTGSIRVLKPM